MYTANKTFTFDRKFHKFELDIERKELSSKIQKHLQTLPSTPTLLVKPDQISYPIS